MAGVSFDPGVFEGMTPEQQYQILQAMAKNSQATPQQGGPDWSKILQEFATNKAKGYVEDKALEGLSGSLASFASPTSSATSLVPSAPSLSSGAAESLAQSMGPFAPGQAPITPTAAAAPGAGAYLGALGIPLSAAGIYKATQMKDKKAAGIAGGLSGAGLGLSLSAAAPLVGMGPLGWGAIGLMALGGGGLGALAAHKTTRDVAREHSAKLAGQGQADPVWQQYVGAMREQHNSAPPDLSKPFHGGQYASWDEYKKAGLDAGDLTGVYGNMNTFGPEWAHLGMDKQKAVTQALIDSNLYKSKKGEVVVTDENKARELYSNVLSGFATPQVRPASVVGQKIYNY